MKQNVISKTPGGQAIAQQTNHDSLLVGRMIKAIIFDFGRVISEQKPQSLFRSYEEDLGLQPDTINSIMFDSQAWHDALLGRKTFEEFWHAIGPLLGLNTPEAIEAFHRRYHGDEAINTGLLHLLHRLHGRFKMAMLSNSPPGLFQWLVDWKIHHLFDVVFCSGDEGIVKPDPAAFQIVLQRLDVEPEEAVFIDDTIDHVLAARMHGLRGIRFTTTESLEVELGLLLESEGDGYWKANGSAFKRNDQT
jgi:HAD superfamily hydrolase (TIGR01509 family)